MLFTFTAAESLLLGAATATYDSKTVLMAVVVTTGVVFALTCFAMQSK
jgi:FtsH-binding integral membrane protein